MTVRVLLLVAFVVAAQQPAFGVDTAALVPATELARPSGGEIRVVLCQDEIPRDLISCGLVSTDESGSLQPCLADTWVRSRRGQTWIFRIRAGLRAGDGSPVTETDILRALKTAPARGVLDPVARSIRLAGESLIFDLVKRDAGFPRVLTRAAAFIAMPGRASVGPYLIHARDTERAVLARNPHSLSRGMADTIHIQFVGDIARAVFLVEAGSADIAPVGDEDLARLRAAGGNGYRLVTGGEDRIHALVPRRMPRSATLLVRRAVDREFIARMLLNGRASALGPARAPLTEQELNSFPGVVQIGERLGRDANRRILPRIAYDLRRSGLRCEIVGSDNGHMIYRDFYASELPTNAVPLFAVRPFWIVSSRVAGFEPRADGGSGLLGARLEVAP